MYLNSIEPSFFGYFVQSCINKDFVKMQLLIPFFRIVFVILKEVDVFSEDTGTHNDPYG